MHKQDAGWATSGPRFFDRVCGIIAQHKPETVLDYGCGKGAMLRALVHARLGGVRGFSGYDPAIEVWNVQPDAAEFVICTDVLEHIEPSRIDAVLNHIRDLTQKVAYFVIHTGDCGFVLPDGRPAHILQRPQEWWEDKLWETFEGFTLKFSDTGLPLRFEVTATRGQ